MQDQITHEQILAATHYIKNYAIPAYPRLAAKFNYAKSLLATQLTSQSPSPTTPQLSALLYEILPEHWEVPPGKRDGKSDIFLNTDHTVAKRIIQAL